MKIEYVEINKLKYAKYNPRVIDDKKAVKLKKSIEELGFIIPIIVNKANNTIIAGHQRTRQAKLLGYKKLPCFFIEKEIRLADEIQFNQLHNFSDFGIGLEQDIKLDRKLNDGFNEIPYDSNLIINNANAVVVKSYCRLMIMFGNVFTALFENGRLVIGHNYIKACQVLRQDINVSIICNDKAEFYLNETYGQFNYDNLEKNTYVQGMAQLHRSRRAGGRPSRLYEDSVLEYIDRNKPDSVFDFGCGKGTYINYIQNNYDINAVALEFYNNNKKSIHVAKGHFMIDNLIENLKENGLFEVVVCDSVLNSVDSMDAENAVLSCLNIFAKDIIFLSGRSLKVVNSIIKSAISSNDKHLRFFLDENSFTSDFRQGNWYYQHFHDENTLRLACEKAGLELSEYNCFGSTFHATAHVKRRLNSAEIKKAIDFEFDLPLPFGNSYKRNVEVLECLKEIGVYDGN